jgi:hypothetical protein
LLGPLRYAGTGTTGTRWFSNTYWEDGWASTNYYLDWKLLCEGSHFIVVGNCLRPHLPCDWSDPGCAYGVGVLTIPNGSVSVDVIEKTGMITDTVQLEARLVRAGSTIPMTGWTFDFYVYKTFGPPECDYKLVGRATAGWNGIASLDWPVEVVGMEAGLDTRLHPRIKAQLVLDQSSPCAGAPFPYYISPGYGRFTTQPYYGVATSPETGTYPDPINVQFGNATSGAPMGGIGGVWEYLWYKEGIYGAWHMSDQYQLPSLQVPWILGTDGTFYFTPPGIHDPNTSATYYFDVSAFYNLMHPQFGVWSPTPIDKQMRLPWPVMYNGQCGTEYSW